MAEHLLERGFGGKFQRIGLPDEFAVLGDPDAIYKYYGLDPRASRRRCTRSCASKHSGTTDRKTARSDRSGRFFVLLMARGRPPALS